MVADCSSHRACLATLEAGNLARPEGIEPPTSWFEARRSVRLSYGRTMGKPSHERHSRRCRCGRSPGNRLEYSTAAMALARASPLASPAPARPPRPVGHRIGSGCRPRCRATPRCGPGIVQDIDLSARESRSRAPSLRSRHRPSMAALRCASPSTAACSRRAPRSSHSTASCCWRSRRRLVASIVSGKVSAWASRAPNRASARAPPSPKRCSATEGQALLRRRRTLRAVGLAQRPAEAQPGVVLLEVVGREGGNAVQRRYALMRAAGQRRRPAPTPHARETGGGAEA